MQRSSMQTLPRITQQYQRSEANVTFYQRLIGLNSFLLQH